MELENLRNEPPVGTMLIFTSLHPKLLPVLFHDYANEAVRVTVSALIKSENANYISNSHIIPAITFWFLTLESYINSLYRLSLLYNSTLQGYEKQRNRKSLYQKFADIYLNFSGQSLKNGYYSNIINEFSSYRNSLFHDLYFYESIVYHKTKFSGVAAYSNEIDLMESIRITLDCIQFYRLSIKNLDLMPSINIQCEFEKLDKFYNEYILPVFLEILKKRDLMTNYSFNCKEDLADFSVEIGARTFAAVEGPHIHPKLPNTDVALRKYNDRLVYKEGVFSMPNYRR